MLAVLRSLLTLFQLHSYRMIELYGLKFGYGKGGFVLNIPTMDIRRGEVVAVTWLSGCGKTTLLNILAGILKLDSGRLIVDKVNFGDVADGAARNFCARHMGLIFREFELLEYLNVRENIVLPFRINRVLSLTRKAHTRA